MLMGSGMNDALEMFSRSFSPPCGTLNGEISIPSLTGGADAFLALSLATNENPRIVIAVTDGLPNSDRLYDDVNHLASLRDIMPSAYKTRVMEFPPLLGGDKSALGTRLKTITAIKAWSINPYPLVVVAPYLSLAASFSSSVGGEPANRAR